MLKVFMEVKSLLPEKTRMKSEIMMNSDMILELQAQIDKLKRQIDQFNVKTSKSRKLIQKNKNEQIIHSPA